MRFSVTDDICFMTAVELAKKIAGKELSSREVMTAHLDQISRINPQVNAIVSKLDDDQALALADEADRKQASGAPLGPLHGLPTAFKDLEDATGFPTSMGSPLFAGTMPAHDSILVERIRAAGAIGIGKTNVPEFGLGSHSFNPVFGVTRNPYNLNKTAGGSSGGAGASLATGMLPIADGSDMGGSLRNPGNFNNVVGFRPSSGLVPKWPNSLPWIPLSVKGPLARTVGDVALIMQALAGPDARDQNALNVSPEIFAQPLERSFKDVKIAWSLDLGELPVEPDVRNAIEGKRQVFSDLGATLVETAPDLSGADRVFRDLRAFSLTGMADLLAKHRDEIKPEAVWNIEEGLALSPVEISQAMIVQSDLYDRARRFTDEYEFLITVVNQVPPFDVDTRFPSEVDGVPMETYIAWMKSAYWISATRLPAISVPCGFTPDGLPVGVQIVGRPGGDFGVLQLAHAFEQVTNVWQQRPAIVG
jgi:amidase